ncbi:MAG TPA: helix-hairpin-helix domain-containing protein [Acidimicrobiia bacterium]|nr:helix-hairpin-helix domain-containing protein [Acidimicrobiia bacterium]
MPDRSAPPGASGELPPAAGVPSSGVGTPSSPSSAGDRVVALWHRVRSGEDPLAFGAVVVVLALAAGLLWFWAGARHGGVAAASASPGPPARAAGRPEAGSARRPAAADQSGGPLDGTVTPPGTPPVPVSATTGPALAVHVAGAVAHPGLYRLPFGSRVADAVARAGGSVLRADLDRLNLAARLVDGQRVYVPRRGEAVPPEPVAASAGGGAGEGESGSEPAEPIDLNAAGLAALDSLPGIGPATARAILEERARRGGFRSTRDLLRVPGIGEGRFARLKDHVRV